MLVHPQFDPIAIAIGPIAIRWYGLMYLVAFMLFMWLGRIRARRMVLSGWIPRDIDDLLFYGVLGVILGGRLGYVLFYKPAYYLANPVEILAVWQGGMSFHGGFLGVLIAVWWSTPAQTERRWLDVTDFIAPLVPLGLAAGRMGNFINGELVGRVTTCPWAMIFPNVDNLPRHPSQLYQFALEGVAAVRPAVVVRRLAAAARRGLGRCSCSATACSASSPNSAASPTISSACWRSACRWGNGSRCR
jgi:phosphatidylglycerol:prolipoprotein diacylglycerol transferase